MRVGADGGRAVFDRVVRLLNPLGGVAKLSIVAGLVGSLACASTLLQKYFDFEIAPERMEVRAILASRAPRSLADEVDAYVPRPALESALESYLRMPRSPAGSYLVITGARGAGKSTLMRHVPSKLGGGVVVVPLDGESIDLGKRVMQAALQGYTPRLSLFGSSVEGQGDLQERLKRATEAYRRKHPKDKDWRPTIVFEVNEFDDRALLKRVCTCLKDLTHDLGLCHGVLVLSSPFAVAELPYDAGRRQFLRVGSFSHEEATTRLDLVFATFDKEVASDAAVAEAKACALALTTRASLLGTLTESLRSATSEADFRARTEEWAREFEAEAFLDVKGAAADALIIRKRDEADKECAYTTRRLMRELLDATAPVVLPTAKYAVLPAELASKIRTSGDAKKTFTVDLVARTVDFASIAHRKVAAELLAGLLVSPADLRRP
jgi:hypothetical protein